MLIRISTSPYDCTISSQTSYSSYLIPSKINENGESEILQRPLNDQMSEDSLIT